MIKSESVASQRFEFVNYEMYKLFGKTMMKNAYLPQIGTLSQFGSDMLALICSCDSILTTVPIFYPQIAKRSVIFGK